MASAAPWLGARRRSRRRWGRRAREPPVPQLARSCCS